MSSNSNLQNIIEGRKILPTNVKPIHYKLTLRPDLKTFKYTGSVYIDLQVNEESSEISLNSKEINLEAGKLLTNEGDIIEEFTKEQFEINEDDEVLKISLKKSLSTKQQVKLYLKFDSELNDKLKGFYRSHFKNEETGEDKVMATTQFEATDARMAFPCWDEPALKATFDVALEVSKM
ncbi:leukotriene A4 hydrolase N-terminal domain-containing protein [Conidiobolus coronatus NRRL 28638]|uniref:Leukotriene A4 hydrolase N-terminal domain-containing protein n=1 Tax=Conidiobolus coronatus (strain ATCC 28846 / CBS 209.66 / NRRL 28638) TaxID=796925 RepID=A0A137P365_CONC2|nr:leukotriene A4 hydrolase N-terminal domain-containing protein [Conidiobolus coronatus NRRL 28638]|eukprot:KXN69418.1 leukotriene A4 hydrolase N-terminal domain-containing protein [Conidiobolus coronatus NRRL 28638]